MDRKEKGHFRTQDGKTRHIPCIFYSIPISIFSNAQSQARSCCPYRTVRANRRIFPYRGISMRTMTFKTQYRKFRMLTARFFSYWFFIIFATLGVAIAVMERFTKVLGVEHLDPLMILILAYAILVYIVTERAKVLDDIHENLQSAKAEAYPTRDAVSTAAPLLIARASADAQGRRRIFHAALHGLGGKRLAEPGTAAPPFEGFVG